MVVQLFDLAMLEPDRCFCCSSMHGLANHVATDSCWLHPKFLVFISMGMQVEDLDEETMKATYLLFCFTQFKFSQFQLCYGFKKNHIWENTCKGLILESCQRLWKEETMKLCSWCNKLRSCKSLSSEKAVSTSPRTSIHVVFSLHD